VAEVTDPKLTIEAQPGFEHRWQISVQYTIRFADYEVGSWFTETVELLSVTAEGNREEAPLLTFRHPPWRLDPGECPLLEAGHYHLQRTTPRQLVGPDILDEKPDSPVILKTLLGETIGSRSVFLFQKATLRRLDHIYARIQLNPCLPQPGTAVSKVVEGHFGA
jgi:hypothetical protein